MGYLMAGALKGVSDEYLKQSGEERKNKYQELRDKRLDEMKRGQQEHKAGLDEAAAETEREFRSTESEKSRTHTTDERIAGEEHKATESQAERDWKSENYDFGYGQTIVRDGEVTHTGKDRPLAGDKAADLKAEETVYRRAPGGEKGSATTHKDLLDEWRRQAFVDEKGTDEYGMPTSTKKRRADFPGYTEYVNQTLHKDSRVEPNDLESIRRDPERLWQLYQEQPEFSQPGGEDAAIQSMISKGYDWFLNDAGIRKKAKEAADKTGEGWTPGVGGTTPGHSAVQGGSTTAQAPPGREPMPQSEDKSGYLMTQLKQRAAQGDPSAQAQLAAMAQQGIGG